jgi:hypothetical protein
MVPVGNRTSNMTMTAKKALLWFLCRNNKQQQSTITILLGLPFCPLCFVLAAKHQETTTKHEFEVS